MYAPSLCLVALSTSYGAGETVVKSKQLVQKIESGILDQSMEYKTITHDYDYTEITWEIKDMADYDD